MRRWIAVMAVLVTAACAKSPAPTAPGISAVAGVGIKPARIKRIGRELPAGYEVTNISAVAAPAAIWGLGADWTAAPAQCATLADPAAGHGQSAQGLSASGVGGIVYAVVGEYPAHHLNRAVLADCPQWIMTNGPTRTDVRLIDPPSIDGTETLGMTSDTTTSAEGGTRIDSRAKTFTAYLGDYYAFTTIITDPGSAQPPLAPQFAADLLTKTVSALRG